jgi:ATP-dependent DNA helicase RecQ
MRFLRYRYPLLVGSVAEHVARVGRLPLVDALWGERTAADGRGGLSGPGRDLLARTSVRDRVSFDGPVLLVDDTVQTRWTVAVASALLAESARQPDPPQAVHPRTVCGDHPRAHPTQVGPG